MVSVLERIREKISLARQPRLYNLNLFARGACSQIDTGK